MTPTTNNASVRSDRRAQLGEAMQAERSSANSKAGDTRPPVPSGGKGLSSPNGQGPDDPKTADVAVSEARQDTPESMRDRVAMAGVGVLLVSAVMLALIFLPPVPVLAALAVLGLVGVTVVAQRRAREREERREQEVRIASSAYLRGSIDDRRGPRDA